MRGSKRASTRAHVRERTFFFATAAAVLDVGPIVAFEVRAGSPRASRVPIDDGPTFFAQRAWPRAPGMGGSEKRTPSVGKAFVTPRSVRCFSASEHHSRLHPSAFAQSSSSAPSPLRNGAPVAGKSPAKKALFDLNIFIG